MSKAHPSSRAAWCAPWAVACVIASGAVVACGRTEPLRDLTDAGPSVVGEDAGVDAGVPGPVSCVVGRIAMTRAKPTVMFVIDRSGSMNASFGQGNTRWSALTEALAVTLPAVDDDVKMGALFYPASEAGATCSVTGATILPDFRHAPFIVGQMLTSFPAGQTPTADALLMAADAVSSVRAATAARALVLATDGAPNCNTALNPRACVCANTNGRCGNGLMCLDAVRTTDRIETLRQQGLPTYVIGIQDEDDTLFVNTLDAMAMAGGRPRTKAAHAYYAASSEAEMRAALVAIRDQVAGCVFLTTSVPDDNGRIVVLVNGQAVPAAGTGTDGWVWSNKTNGEIAIIGASCDMTAALDHPVVEADVVCALDGGR